MKKPFLALLLLSAPYLINAMNKQNNRKVSTFFSSLYNHSEENKSDGYITPDQDERDMKAYEWQQKYEEQQQRGRKTSSPRANSTEKLNQK